MARILNALEKIYKRQTVPPPPIPFNPEELLERPVAYPSAPEEGIYTPVFAYEGLINDPKVIHNHDFMRDSRYIKAFDAAHQAQGSDYNYYWRLHVALWCASIAAKLPGHYVECGVWRGAMSCGILNYIQWPIEDKQFFLFDTYEGLVETHLTDEEKKQDGKIKYLNQYYANQYELAAANFAPYSNVHLVKGTVPETLTTVDIPKVCYLSLDMNCAPPEIAATEYFWDRLSPGAPVLLDDFGHVQYEEQKRLFNDFAKRKGVEILHLPTGQGILLKP